MSDGYAARMGDPIIHTTLLADIISVVAETATYGLAGAYVMAAATAAAPFVAAGAVAMTVTAISSSCVLSGIVVGAVASLTGASSAISNMADSLGNALSPPDVAGTISTGSPDVFINGLPAARAAGMPTLSADSASDIEPQPPETFADYGGWLLGMAGGMAQMLWQPVIATAAKGTVALEEDRVSCEKHSGPQYLAEGSSSVFINGHPAVRSGDQTTCGGKVGGTVSPNVIIGGKPLVVRDILSGKQPGLNLVPLALGLIRGRPGSLLRNMSCIFAAAAAGMAADAAFSHVFASGNPVHAATGVKVLNDEADLDFTAPAHFPLRWQRCYNSLNPRSGMHGPGWSTLFDEVILLEGDRATWHEQSGRTLSFTLPAPDGALYSVSEGLIIRRNPQGDVLIADDDGAAWRLFRATPGEPQRLRLATLSDEYANALESEWDAQGRLVAVRDEGDALEVQLHYGDTRFPDRLTEAWQHRDGERWLLMRWGYDGAGRLVGVTDASGVETRAFGWHEAHLLAWHRLPGGLRSDYVWALHDHWRVVAQHDSRGDGCDIRYDLAARITYVTTREGYQREHHWDERGLITAFKDERGGWWQYGWNEDEQLLWRSDPSGHEEHFEYDAAGNRAVHTDADGRRRAVTWLAQRALPVKVTEPDGGTTHFFYDSRHHLVREVDALGQATRYARNNFGQVISVTDALGNVSRRKYDDRGLLTSDTDCSGSETRYEWHPRGWLLREILPDGRHTDYEHDAAGRVLTRRQPDRPVERIEWDHNGLPVAYTGPDNRRYAREYDASGQLVLTRNPAGQTVRLESDAQGRAVRLINENGEATAFRYGADGLLLAETASDGVVTGYGYDAAGRLREKVFARGHRQAIRWGFDYTAAGLPSARSTPDGQTRFGYDACGRLITAARHPALSTGGFAQHGEDGLRLTRDLLGRVTGEQGEEGAMARAYDALGNLTALTLPDGRTLRQHYYGSGHLTAIALDEDIISEFTRDRLHREDSRTQGRLTTYTTYNRRGFPAAQDTYRDGLRQPSTPQWAWRRSWDLAGRLKTEKAGEMTSRYRSWRYGEDDRLEEQSGSLPGNRQWEWDAAGNPLDAGTNAGGPSAQSGTPRRDTPARSGTPGNDDLPEMWRNLYAAHGLTGEGSAPEAGVTGEPGRRYVAHNRVTRLGEVEWRYDVHGRVIGKREPGRHLALEWNGEHRLAKVTVTPDRPAMPQTVVQFRYDALGRRTEKQVHYVSRNRSWHPVVPLPASYRVRFVWDGLRLVQEIRRDGSTTYVYSDTDSYVPLARIDTPDRAREYTRIYWYHTRPDGTPEQLSDSNGEEVWRIVNDAWGRVDTAWGEINSAAVREDNLRMQGQYLDRETGLHYNLFRYYDADSMHFISPDPIGLAGGLNLYAYAPDPVNWVDPLGLKCWNSARRDYWKAEAKAAPKGMYSPVNMLRMRFGLAPRIRVKELHFRTGEERIRNVSLELNHRYWPQRDGKHVDIPYNLEKVTPWEHAAKDPYRHVGSELLEIIQNIGNYKGF